MPDPTNNKKEKVELPKMERRKADAQTEKYISQNVLGKPVENVRTPKPDYDAVGTMDDYFGKTKVKYRTSSGAMREFKPVTSIDYYKQKGEIMVQGQRGPVTLKGADASNFMKTFYNQAGPQREKDYNAYMSKMGPAAQQIVNLMNSKDKQSVIKKPE